MPGAEPLSDYYDAHPIRVPDVPITITGLPGSGHDSAGASVASLTGLSFCDILQWVVHREGTAIPGIVASSGLSGLRQLERAELDRALAARPSGLIVLGPDALLDASALELVLERSALVWVFHDLELLAAKIESELAARPMRYLPWFEPPHVCRGELDRFFDDRRAAFEEATLQVDGTGRSSQEIAHQIITHFALWEAV
jgi:shikimate kinase